MADSSAAFSPLSNSSPRPTSSLLPQLTFTQGLLVGQLSIILVVVALVRYLLFEDASPLPSEVAEGALANNRKAPSRHFPASSPPQVSSRQSLLSLSLSSAPTRVRSPPPASSSEQVHSYGSGPALAVLGRIPEAVGYDMEVAADIDVGWLNVLLAHIWEGYRDDFLAGGSDRPQSDEDLDVFEDQEEPETNSAQRTARDLLEDVLNRPKVEDGKMEFLDHIQVTECLLGNSYPILSNARVRPRDDQGRVRIELDVDYTDLLSLSLQTSLLINYPRPRFAVLPISLGLRITRFSGTISLSFNSFPPNKTSSTKRSRHTLSISLHPDFLLKATCSSLVGSRAKLQDIPKIEQLILQRLRSAIGERLGWPRTFDVEMPDLIRRSRPKRNKHQRRSAGCMVRDEMAERLDQYTSLNSMGGIAEEDELSEGPDLSQEVYPQKESSEALDPQLALQARRRRATARAQAEAVSRARAESATRTQMEDLHQTPKASRRATSTGLRNGNGPSAAHGVQRGHAYSSSLANSHHGEVNGHDVNATIRQRLQGPPLVNGNSNGSSHYTSISRRPPNPRYSSTPSASSTYQQNPRGNLWRGSSALGTGFGLEEEEELEGDEIYQNGRREVAVGKGVGKLPTVRDWVQRSSGEL